MKRTILIGLALALLLLPPLFSGCRKSDPPYPDVTLSVDRLSLVVVSGQPIPQTITIKSGSGKYAITVANPKVAKAHLTAKGVEVMGVSAGRTELTIRDEKSSKVATIPLEVNAYANLDYPDPQKKEYSMGIVPTSGLPGVRVLPLFVGGSGEYELTTSDPSGLQTSLTENGEVALTAHKAGVYTLTITDKKLSPPIAHPFRSLVYNQFITYKITVEEVPDLDLPDKLFLGIYDDREFPELIKVSLGRPLPVTASVADSLILYTMENNPQGITLVPSKEGKTTVTFTDPFSGRTVQVPVVVKKWKPMELPEELANDALVLHLENGAATYTFQITGGSSQFEVKAPKGVEITPLEGDDSSSYSIKVTKAGPFKLDVRDKKMGNGYEAKIMVSPFPKEHTLPVVHVYTLSGEPLFPPASIAKKRRSSTVIKEFYKKQFVLSHIEAVGTLAVGSEHEISLNFTWDEGEVPGGFQVGDNKVMAKVLRTFDHGGKSYVELYSESHGCFILTRSY